MPFSRFDYDESAFDEFRRRRVSVVVMLAEEEECLIRAGRDLKRLYEAGGLQVIHVPSPDFGVPDEDALRIAVDEAVALARSGRHVAVHCWAGIGRTGMFLACMAVRGLGRPPDEAMLWIRSQISGAIQTAEQEQRVRALALAKHTAGDD